MVAHFSFLAAAAFLPVLGFILLPVAVAVLMFKHWNGFGLHIVADRAVTLSGTSLGFGGRLRLSPIAVDMVCHIQPFAAGAFLPVLGIVIFPCFIMDAVFMNRNRLFLRIFADGAGTFSGTCFGCGRLLCYRPIIESMVAHFSFIAAGAFFPMLGSIIFPAAVAVFMGGSRPLSAAGIAADCPVAPFTPTCYHILAVWVTDNVNRPGPYFKRICLLRMCEIIEKYIRFYLNAFLLDQRAVQYQLHLILKIRAACRIRGLFPLHLICVASPVGLPGHILPGRQHDDGHHCRHHA